MRPFAAMRNAIGVLPVDLFIIVGQSNAEGRGDSALSPAAPNGRYISGSTITNPLADPVGGAATGSMWPAFSNEWFAKTGRLSAFVEQAKGGSSLLAAADGGNGNWSSGNSRRQDAADAANAAIAALNASSRYTLAKVYFVWAQGESESQAINGTTITGALYKDALIELADFFATEVPSMAMMGVVRVGNEIPRAHDSGWLDIRKAQEDACADSNVLRMLYRGTASFPAMGLMVDASDVHYGQAGYNMAGKCAARELAKATETAALPAPGRLATQVWTDTDFTSTTSQTRSHTTHASTKALVVAIPACRGGNSSAFGIGTCTFNGVDMSLLVEAHAGAATPVGLNGLVGVFYLTESAYGAPLGGVTANFVHTPGTDQSALQMVAFDLDTEIQPDNSTSGVLAGVSGTSIAASLTTDANAFVVAVSAIGIPGASLPTTTITGVTEVLDGGAVRSGNDRAVSGCVGYAVVSEAYATNFGAAYSGTVTGAHAVGAFRAKIDGE